MEDRTSKNYVSVNKVEELNIEVDHIIMRISAAKYILLIVIQSISIHTAYCKLVIPTSATKDSDDVGAIVTSRHEALSSLLKQQVSVKDHHEWLINNVKGAFDMFTSARALLEEEEEEEEEAEEVDDMEGTPDRHRRRRAKSVKAKSRKAKKELQQCLMDLKECQNERDEPSMLAVQMGNKCGIRRHHSGGSGLFTGHDYNYELFIDNMNDDTFLFTNRPYQIESVESTTKFIENFDVMFKDGPPNAAVTFTKDSTNNDMIDAPLVSVFLEAAYEQHTPLSVTYKLSQSPSQASIGSLESFFTDGTEVVDGQEVALFDDCSIFIDDIIDGIAVDDCPGSGGKHWVLNIGYAQIDKNEFAPPATITCVKGEMFQGYGTYGWGLNVCNVQCSRIDDYRFKMVVSTIKDDYASSHAEHFRDKNGVQQLKNVNALVSDRPFGTYGLPDKLHFAAVVSMTFTLANNEKVVAERLRIGVGNYVEFVVQHHNNWWIGNANCEETYPSSSTTTCQNVPNDNVCASIWTTVGGGTPNALSVSEWFKCNTTPFPP